MSESDRSISEPAGPPPTIAGFRLLRKIGDGGMSAVYQSYDVATARPVAVKLLADRLANQPEFVGRFYREARLSRVLEHPHIVQGYASGFDADAGKHFLVLEYIDGPTAHGALTRLGRPSVGLAVRVGIDIARALEFLHERQYVHRDVKPDNILLHPDGVAKLADLGLAKRLNDDSQLTSVHQGVGTTYYMPYEQAVNANLVDGRSDIFALGATLYHLLTGEVPFPGTTHDEVVREKWHGSFRPVREHNPSVPVVVAELVEAALACDPRARIQRAGQFADALAATNRAKRLPSFAHGSSSPGESSPPADAPTRTDLHVPLAPPAATSVPPSVAPPGEATAIRDAGGAPPSTHSEEAALPRRARSWLRSVGAGAVLVGLVAHQATRSRPDQEPNPPVRATVVQDVFKTCDSPATVSSQQPPPVPRPIDD